MQLSLRYVVLLLAFVFPFNLLQAQGIVFERKTAHTKEIAPKALLIQINSQQARIAYATRIKSDELVAMVKKDHAEATRRMIMDFTDNFYYCPVYYFFDTSAEKIKKGDFAGALLDKDLKPATNINLQPGDTNFFIGYYGIMATDIVQPISEKDREAERVHNDMAPADNMRKVYGKGDEDHYLYHADMNPSEPNWIVLDYKFRNVRSPIPWTYYWSVGTDGHTMKLKAKYYRYTSRRLNIIYRPSALKYSATLERFYGPYPYQNQ